MLRAPDELGASHVDLRFLPDVQQVDLVAMGQNTSLRGAMSGANRRPPLLLDTLNRTLLKEAHPTRCRSVTGFDFFQGSTEGWMLNT